MDELLPELVGVILRTYLGDYRPALVRVCKGWHAAICLVARAGPLPRPLSWYELARRGHADLLTWEWEIRMKRKYGNLATHILAGAAAGGHGSICAQAWLWGAHNYNEALELGAKAGHEHICALVMSWGYCDATLMMLYAALGGQIHLCVRAKEWGGAFRGVLSHAAESGNEELCVLIKSWILEAAARVELLEEPFEEVLVPEGLAPSGLPTYLCNDMLWAAARYGHAHLCALAKEWGAVDFDEMLFRAADEGHRAICVLALEWGATSYGNMLNGAAYGGHEDICWWAKRLGATDFRSMHAWATAGSRDLTMALAKNWMDAA